MQHNFNTFYYAIIWFLTVRTFEKKLSAEISYDEL